MELITIKRAHHPSELMIFKGLLESQGIHCYIKNEYITQVMNYIPSFEAELQVAASDVKVVQEILDELDRAAND
jgi:hypothetical protein